MCISRRLTHTHTEHSHFTVSVHCVAELKMHENEHSYRAHSVHCFGRGFQLQIKGAIHLRKIIWEHKSLFHELILLFSRSPTVFCILQKLKSPALCVCVCVCRVECVAAVRWVHLHFRWPLSGTGQTLAEWEGLYVHSSHSACTFTFSEFVCGHLLLVCGRSFEASSQFSIRHRYCNRTWIKWW